MANKEQIIKLENAIKDSQSELATIRQEKQNAADNPEQLVMIKKKESRITKRLHALERAKKTAEYKPAAPTDQEELLQGFMHYAEEHSEKMRKVQDDIIAAKDEHAKVMQGLQKAAEECDTEKTLELSDKKSDIENKLNILNDMLERVSALPVFPSGAAEKEWSSICERVLPEWNTAILRVETLASEYKKACADLLSMYDTLKSTQDEIKRRLEENGCTPPVFKPILGSKVDSSKLMVSKGDYIRLNIINNPLSGQTI